MHIHEYYQEKEKKKKHAINSAEDFFHAIPYLTENTTFIFRRLIMNSRVLCLTLGYVTLLLNLFELLFSYLQNRGNRVNSASLTGTFGGPRVFTNNREGNKLAL